MQKALFDTIGESIIDSINKAKRSIHIAMAWFTNDAIYCALLTALRDRQINVELVLLDDVINWQPYAPNFSEIIKAGGSIYIANRNIGFMHHKFCVVDNTITITGSYNWTYYAESRNIENVLITDNVTVADQYEKEFIRIKSILSKATECPKYDQETIEQIENVDYEMLNYEIQKAAELKSFTQLPIFETHIQVKIVEKKQNPVSCYNLGVRAEDGENVDCMAVILKRGTKLPSTQSLTFKGYLDERDSICCDLLYGLSSNASKNTKLKARPLKEITEGCTSEELNIRISITLNPNGYLLAEISCDETNKAIELTCTNPDLVKYE